jgi:hypothetical protein
MVISGYGYPWGTQHIEPVLDVIPCLLNRDCGYSYWYQWLLCCTPFPWHIITRIRVVYIWGAEWTRVWSTCSYPLSRKLFIQVFYKQPVPSQNNVGADAESTSWDKVQECPVICSYLLAISSKKNNQLHSHTLTHKQSFIMCASWKHIHFHYTRHEQ